MPQETHPLVGAVAALESSLDRFVSEAWSALEPGLVRELMGRLSRVQARIDSQKLHAARRLEATGEAKRAGASSTGALLAGDFGGDRRMNDQLVTLGKNLDPVSRTQAALDAGDITLGQSRVITDAVTKAPEEHREAAEAGMLASAPDLTLKDLRRRGDRIADTWAEPEHVDQTENDILVERERRARANTRFRMWDNTNGTHSGEFTLPDLEAEMLKAAVEAIAAPRRDHLKYGCQTEPEATNDLPADYPHRLGLAFADLCSHFQSDGLPQAGGTGATLIVRLDQDTLTEGIRASTLSSGTRLSASQTRKLACRVGIIPEIWGGQSLPLDQGPEARFFNRTQRRALAARDGGCSFPGCDRPPQWCEAHHLTPHSVRPDNRLSNGVLLCTFHHHVVHDQGWQHRRADDGTIEWRPPGTTRWRRNHRWRA